MHTRELPAAPTSDRPSSDPPSSAPRSRQSTQLLDIGTLSGPVPASSAVLPFTTPATPGPRPPSTPPSASATPFREQHAYPAPTYLQNERRLTPATPLSHVAAAVDGGVVGASDAAADAIGPHRNAWLEPRLPDIAPEPTGRADLLELLWASEGLAARAMQSATLRASLEPLHRREVVTMDPPGAGEDGRKAKEALRLLGSEGAIDDERSLETIWLESVYEGAGLRPALVHVTGDLVVGLDPGTLLQAIVAILEPLAKGDTTVAEALQSASAASQSAWQSARGLEVIIAKLGDIVARSRLDLSWPQVALGARRAVLERRAFDKRTVLGSEHLRAMLHIGGAPTGVVVYLPMALQARLPLYDRISVRTIVEAHPSQDALESQRFALFVHALARRIH